MRAILFSSDFSSCEAIAELEALAGKPASDINFVVINEACAVEDGEDNSFFVDTMAFLKEHFGKFYLLNLLAVSREEVERRVMAADAIFCCGGNTEYLKTVFDRTGFTDFLPQALKSTVWCGSSAGSMILGYMISSDWQRKLYGDFNDYGTKEYLELVNFALLPHLTGGDLASDETDKVVFDISRDVDLDIYALSDWSAIVIDGDRLRVIGEHWTKLRGGDIIDNKK